MDKTEAMQLAAKIQADSEKFYRTIKDGVVPDLTDESQASVFALMCVASGGQDGASEEAIHLLSEQVMNAHLTVTLLQMIFEGALQPTIKNGQLAFSKGIRASELTLKYNKVVLDALKEMGE
jgi:hypothetical protein